MKIDFFPQIFRRSQVQGSNKSETLLFSLSRKINVSFGDGVNGIQNSIHWDLVTPLVMVLTWHFASPVENNALAALVWSFSLQPSTGWTLPALPEGGREDRRVPAPMTSCAIFGDGFTAHRQHSRSRNRCTTFYLMARGSAVNQTAGLFCWRQDTDIQFALCRPQPLGKPFMYAKRLRDMQISAPPHPQSHQKSAKHKKSLIVIVVVVRFDSQSVVSIFAVT